MSTLTCPSGQAFDHHSSQCVDASTVHCIETDVHHRHKRSTEKVHSVPVDVMKKASIELLQTFRIAARKFVKESAPTMLEVYDSEYAPVFVSFYKDFERIYNDKMKPRVEKFLEYAKRVAGRVIQKVSQTYEMSNSTHINLVSFSDLFSDLRKDAEPLMALGRYLSSRLSPQVRSKRSATTPADEIPELMLPLLEPYFQPVAENIMKFVDGSDESVLSKIVIPVIKEMISDEEALFNLKRVYWSFKAAFFPLLHDILEKQSFYTPEGTVVQIPNYKIEEAQMKFRRESKPIIIDLVHKYGQKLLFKAADHVQILLDSMHKFGSAYGNHAGVLSDQGVRFLLKHKGLFKITSKDQTDIHSASEIVNDLKPIAVTFLQMVSDYLSQMENSWFSFLFNKDSFLYQILNAGQPSYAVPSGNGYGGKPSTPSNKKYDVSFLTNNRVNRNVRRG